MPWCPSCNTEYEAQIEECADCHIPLVSDDEYKEVEKFELIGYVPHEPRQLLKDVVEYLKYSKIDPIKQVAEHDQVAIYVAKSQKKAASKFFKGYIAGKMAEQREALQAAREDEPDSEPEYETVNLNSEARLKEMQASAYSFIVIGIALTLFSVLNLTGILSMINSNVYLIVFLVFGLACIVVSILSFRRVPHLKEEAENLKAHMEEIMNWFETRYTKASYLKKKKIKLKQHDEGSLFFVVADKMKKDLKRSFPEDSDALINSGCEMIFEKHFNDYEEE